MIAPRSMLALVMTVQATLALALPSGVLCVSSDGHVALEGPEAPCCHGETHSGSSVSHAGASAGSCCGPCVDIELVDSEPALRAEQGADIVPSPLLVTPMLRGPLASLLPPDPCLRATGSPPAPRPVALLSLRTVVLTR